MLWSRPSLYGWFMLIWSCGTMSGWWFEPLWKILVNWDDYGKIKNVPNHQPDEWERVSRKNSIRVNSEWNFEILIILELKTAIWGSGFTVWESHMPSTQFLFRLTCKEILPVANKTMIPPFVWGNHFCPGIGHRNFGVNWKCPLFWCWCQLTHYANLNQCIKSNQVYGRWYMSIYEPHACIARSATLGKHWISIPNLFL